MSIHSSFLGTCATCGAEEVSLIGRPPVCLMCHNREVRAKDSRRKATLKNQKIAAKYAKANPYCQMKLDACTLTATKWIELKESGLTALCEKCHQVLLQMPERIRKQVIN